MTGQGHGAKCHREVQADQIAFVMAMGAPRSRDAGDFTAVRNVERERRVEEAKPHQFQINTTP
jgi:hypothetical protein